MNKIYGYCRISTAQQSIERQVRNILKEYPNAIIIKEVYTGTKIYNRKEFNKLLEKVKEGDTIVFDSVSRMSRNTESGFILYEELFNKGIDLIFLKEQHISTTTYKKTLNNQIEMTNTNADILLKAINEYLMILAKEQIKLAFLQAEKEVKDLQQRTKEGIETARLNGKQIGGVEGKKLTTKKSIEAKSLIKQYNKAFDGTLNDIDTISIIKSKLNKLDRGTYYKYKKELVNELNTNN